MSNLGDAMGDAIKRRIQNADTQPAMPVDRKKAEMLASEEAQRKAYEARLKSETKAK